MKHTSLDVVIVGGGHAGCEAAHAAVRVGARAALVTIKRENLGVLSCNPAIGGLGKGHLVREVDALDGLIGRVADSSAIQFRLLNRRKGPAVQGPRCQADRSVYKARMRAEIEAEDRLALVEGEVVSLIVKGGCVRGVRLADGSEIFCRAVVLTTGTFLRGVMYVGDTSREGGREGDRPSVALSDQIAGLGLPVGRLRTGTPPRLDGRTIDWSKLDFQPGDDVPTLFSFLEASTRLRQVSCGITHTNAQTHDIIRQNIDKSAPAVQNINGSAPRYCPSIEDKVVRFPDKSEHQLFLEPEGLDTHTVYPNGIATSLPASVQSVFVRSISGLEAVKILKWGYTVEYDYINPRALRLSLETMTLPGLFLAGQINGTTGYEEAAAQGLVAGINAVKYTRGEDPVIFSRSNSYIGVMIDDLTTRGVSEPYRMFTSRAEFRLSLRADNADQRLTPLGIDLGCVRQPRAHVFRQKMTAVESLCRSLKSRSLTPTKARAAGLPVKEDGRSRTAFELLSFQDIDFQTLIRIWPDLADIPHRISSQVEKDALYAHYIERQAQSVAALRADEAHKIPRDFDYRAISGLSNELREKLDQIQPETIGQAGRIDGMTPAALTLVLAFLRRREKVAM